MAERCADAHLGRPGCGRTRPRPSRGFGSTLCDHCYTARARWVEDRLDPSHPLSDVALGRHWRRLEGWTVMGTARAGTPRNGWAPRWEGCPGCHKRFLRARQEWETCLPCETDIATARRPRAWHADLPWPEDEAARFVLRLVEVFGGAEQLHGPPVPFDLGAWLDERADR